MDRDRIFFLPLHINLDLIKQFTKALDKDGDCFIYLCQYFPGLTMEKLKAGIFDGPQIRHLIRYAEFEDSMNELELKAWKALVLVEKNFLDNNKAKISQNLSTTFWLLSETWAAASVSRCTTYFHIWTGFPRIWVQWSGGEIPSGPKRDGDQVSGSLGRSHDGWLQFESEEWPPCRWAFQEFEVTGVHALNFEQWWSNMRFTCTYLYQCPSCSSQ